MKRFTKRVMDIVAYIGPDAQYPETGDTASELTTCSARTLLAQLAVYEDTGLTPAEVVELIGKHANTANELAWTKEQLDNIVKQLGLYHDGMLDSILEFLKINKEGRLLLLPCPIGSKVYVISHKYRAGRDEWWINTGKFRPSDMEKIGDRVFLTYEDAKAKIFTMNKDNQRFWFQEGEK